MAATLYERLGVPPDADLVTLRAAYRHLARRLHPDLAEPGTDGAATTAMALVNEAWRILSDPARRRAYDASLPRPPATPAAARGGATARPSGSRRATASSAAGATPDGAPAAGPATPPPGATATWASASGGVVAGSRRNAWLASVQLQVRRLGGQAARSASQTLTIRHLGVPRDHFEALTGPILAELLSDTEHRVRQSRQAGAAPLDLAIGAALLGLHVYADRLAASARAPLGPARAPDVVHAAEMVDRMWDTMAHEIPHELELALGGNPRATRRVR